LKDWEKARYITKHQDDTHESVRAVLWWLWWRVKDELEVKFL
jgi:hypothetical protein